MLSAATLAAIAMAGAACTSSPGAPGKGGGPGGAAAQITGFLQDGTTQAKLQQWSAATASFDKVLAIDPGDVYANYDLGVMAQGAGNSRAAISFYDKALAGNKAYTPAMYNEALLLESSQPGQALDVYKNIVSIDPHASNAYLRMAFVQAEQGDLADARANEAKAVSIDPSLGKYQLPAEQPGA
jgi:tetratricopeptide (TPR) repeat protein